MAMTYNPETGQYEYQDENGVTPPTIEEQQATAQAGAQSGVTDAQAAQKAAADLIAQQRATAQTAQTTGQQGTGNFFNDLQAWAQGQPGTYVQKLQAFVASHPNYGASITGSKGDKVSIGGRTYDAVIGAGNGGGSGFSWNDVTDGGGSATGGAVTGGNAINPSYLEPWTTPFQAPATNAPTTFGYADFQAPAGFQAPTGESILSDPSYQFRRDQGAKALETSAAARGVLNTGGTLKDLLGYGQNFASQEYGNIWNRDFNNWNTDWTHALDSYATNRANASDVYQKNYQGGRDQLADAWKTYGDQKDTWYANQDRPFSKLSTLASLGLSGSQ
jgi:hypothetical protein